MTQAERRHDRLAVRLSLIISRLVAGETLSVRKLAAEFGVSVRTLRRDFRERLMYLDLEYQSGYCTGKYQWHGSVCHYTGRDVPDIAGVLAVYAERRQDRNGPYTCLMSITLN